MKFARKKQATTSELIQLETVRQDGYCIKFIHNPSEAVQLGAVKQDGYCIQFIHNPSEAVQLEAVRQNGYCIKFIHNPSEAVIKWLFENNKKVFNQFYEAEEN